MSYLAELIDREPHVLVAVRHGQTAYNVEDRLTTVTDVELTERGEQQARALGRALDGVPFDFAHCSPLRRAARTAELALEGARLSRALRPDDRLREPDAGPFEGLCFADLRSGSHPLSAAFAESQRDEDPVFPDGCEPPQVTAAKVESFLREVAGRPGRHFVASHGALLRIAACVFSGQDPRAYRRLSLSNGHAVVFKFYPTPPYQLLGFNLPAL